MERNNELEWNEIVTKPVTTSDGNEIGKVDGLEDTEFVVKDGLIDPKFYRISRNKVESYDDGKVRLALSEDQVKSRFERNSPGYYEGKNVTSGRISNTTT
jgi:sporulation protein YlmC with PRC-barrel domain